MSFFGFHLTAILYIMLCFVSQVLEYASEILSFYLWLKREETQINVTQTHAENSDHMCRPITLNG